MAKSSREFVRIADPKPLPPAQLAQQTALEKWVEEIQAAQPEQGISVKVLLGKPKLGYADSIQRRLQISVRQETSEGTFSDKVDWTIHHRPQGRTNWCGKDGYFKNMVDLTTPEGLAYLEQWTFGVISNSIEACQQAIFLEKQIEKRHAAP